MKINVGQTDKVLRILVGVGLLSLAFMGPKTLFGYVGLIPLLTGLVGYCPLYTVLGLNTCSSKK
jgi:hypothetical protein